MRMRKERIVGVMSGLGLALLVSLMAAVAPHPRTAYADNRPFVDISMGKDTLRQQEATWLSVSLYNPPRHPNSEYELSALTYQVNLQRERDGIWSDADDCETNSMGRDRYLNPFYFNPQTVSNPQMVSHAFDELLIPRNCPTGSYRVQASIKHSGSATELNTGTIDFTVLPGPSLSIESPPSSIYRGNAPAFTFEFHDLLQGETYTYRADVKTDPGIDADHCEAAGFNEEITIVTIDENPEVRSATIADSCSTGNFYVLLTLFDSNGEEATSQADFTVVTDPNAEPFARLVLSSNSVEPGTEISFTSYFFDLQGDENSSVVYKTELNHRDGGDAPEACLGETLGVGFPTDLASNPLTTVTDRIPATCPAGKYRLSVTLKRSGQPQIIFSATANFEIVGATPPPDLTPDAPIVPNYTAMQNAYFSQQLPVGTGCEGILRYAASPLPAGLDFTAATRTIEGTPTSTGAVTVRYTVTDSDGDSDSVSFTITVDAETITASSSGSNFTARAGSRFVGQQPLGTGGDPPPISGLPAGRSFIQNSRTGSVDPDLTPTLAAISNFSERVASRFNETVAAATGGDGAQDYAVSTLPCGLASNDGTPDLAGSPTRAEVSPVTYSVAGDDGHSDSFTFTKTAPKPELSLLGNIGHYGNVQRHTPPPQSLLTLSDRTAPEAIIFPSVLNVRPGLGIDFDVFTTVAEKERTRIYGIDPVKERFKVEIDRFQGQAWNYQELATVVGSLIEAGSLAQWETDLLQSSGSEGPLAITTTELLNVRSGPGLEYEILTTVPQGTEAEIIAIGPNAEWYNVNLGILDEPAWIYAGLTTLVGSLDGVRQYALTGSEGISAADDSPLAVTYSSHANVREGPGENYPVLIALGQGARARIVGIDPDEDWYLIEVDGLEQLGWLLEDVTVLVGSLDGVQRISAEEIARLPAVIAKTPLLDVRYGPGTIYDPATTVPQGTWARIIGIDHSSEWFRIELSGVTDQAWVYRDFTHFVGSPNSLDQIAAAADPTITQAASTQQPTVPAASTQQPAAGSITVELTLPSNGRINLEVNWSDSGACAQLYNVFYRSNPDSSIYFSLETAVTAFTASSKSLSFQTMPENSLISAWCGSSDSGHHVAEVMIDPGEAGTYSSVLSDQANDALASRQ